MLYYLGVDPGKSGAAVVISHKERVSIHKIESILDFDKSTDSDVAEFFTFWKTKLNMTVLENVGPSPQMGVTSSFTFGDGCGFLRGVILTNQIPYEKVVPTAWETALKCRSGGDKKITKAKAQAMFGNQFPFTGHWTNRLHVYKTVTNNIADALLIALYCSKKERGLL